MYLSSFLSASLLLSSAYVAARSENLQTNAMNKRTQAFTIPLTLSPVHQYTAEIEIGNQTFHMLIDTGSSNAWVASTGFKCYNGTQMISRSVCGFGPAYTESSTFQAIPDKHMSVQYSASYISGPVGYDTFSFASGISFDHQEFGAITLAQYSSFLADNFTSGILGLAYQAGTEIYNGSQPSLNPPGALPTTYNSFVTSLAEPGLLPSPSFSLALDPTGGVMVLGGLPNVSTNTPFVQVPTLKSTLPNNTTGYFYQLLAVDGFTYQAANSTSPSANTTKFAFYIDSGNIWTSLPSDSAAAVNALFNPPAASKPNSGGFYPVSCTAIPPTVGFKIGNQTFNTNPATMITMEGATVPGGCVSAISDIPAGQQFPVLGHSFLTSVVAVFDVGVHTMSFASRAASENATGTGGTTSTGGATSTSSRIPTPTGTAGTSGAGGLRSFDSLISSLVSIVAVAALVAILI